MAKLVNLVPGKAINDKVVKESLEDMDVNLPTQIERFLDRAINAIKGYKLSKKKEQFVIAKMVDALDMNPSELQQAVQKVKKNKIVKK